MADDTPLCYIDADAIMFLIDSGEYPDRTQAVKTLFEAADERKLRLVTSMISVTEVAFADFEKERKLLDPEVEKNIDKLWHPASPIRLVEVHETITRMARSLLRHAASTGSSMGGANDMIHVATAIREDAEYVFTYDRKVKRWNGYDGLIVCEPNISAITFPAKPEPKEEPPGLFRDQSDGPIKEEKNRPKT